MDEAFLMRAKRLLEQRAPPRLDHAGLIAAAAERQAASPTALCAARVSDDAPQATDAEALITLLLARPGWQQAIIARSGCFNRAVAKRAVNAA